LVDRYTFSLDLDDDDKKFGDDKTSDEAFVALVFRIPS
jgi:hypothetical protein